MRILFITLGLVASLLLVSNEGLRSIGIVATLGIVVVYLTTVVLVAALESLVRDPE